MYDFGKWETALKKGRKVFKYIEIAGLRGLTFIVVGTLKFFHA
jgi:hypothetical protein